MVYKKRKMENGLTILKERGIRSYIAHQYDMDPALVFRIFAGDVRTTIDQAVKMETAMIRLGLPLTRWDFLYGIKVGQPLIEYAEKRAKL